MGEENTGGNSAESESEDQEQDAGSSEDEKGEGSDDAGDGKDDQGKEDDEEPAVRKKTAKDYIIQRQQKKIQKMQQKKEESDDDDNDDGDDDISPEDEKVVDKIIQRRYGDKFAKLEQVEDEKEMDTFLSANPDFKDYKQKIWKFWQHPSRNHLPVETVAFEVAGRDLLKIGAKRAQEANNKARQTSSDGASSRGGGGKVDYSSMSDADFENRVQEVKRKQRE
jgi:hypothetical protein